MSTPPRPRPVARSLRIPAAFALITAATLALTACGSGDPAGTAGGAAPAGKNAEIPTADVVSSVKKDEAAAELLPSAVRKRGTLRVAASVGGTPPGALYLEDGRTIVGQDIDFADAVAKVLGLELKREAASFEAILPALGSGKYDGQGFAVRADSELKKVTDFEQLCGLNVATGAGTTFEVTLEDNKHVCEEAGKEPYSVKTYAEAGAVWPALRQGRADVVMSTINGLRYAVWQQEGLKFLGEYRRLDVGFAFKKGTKPAPAFRAAVNRLIEDGTYDRVLKKWGTRGSAIDTSRISPPEIKD
ncbi:transporter substrate-binding domain-containing protein [Streptomyces sp. NPDC003006]